MEQYTQKRRSNGLKITIQKNGRLRFNKDVCNEHNIFDYPYANLFKSHYHMIIKLLSKPEEGSFRIIKNSGGVILNTSKYIKNFNLGHLCNHKLDFDIKDGSFYILTN